MMIFEGTLEICERCNKTFFIIHSERRREKYTECKSNGYIAPKDLYVVFETPCKCADSWILCPDCYEEYQKMQKSFMEEYKHERHTE